MTRTQRPMTGAERQRAHRARKQGLPAPPRVLKTEPEQPPEPDEPVDFDGHIEWLLECLHRAIEHNGGQAFFNRFVKAQPASAIKHYVAAATAHARDAMPPGINIVVQQITLDGQTPISGVIASPIRAHVATPRLAAAGGEIVEAGS